MAIEHWWSRLDAGTRRWLTDHNGEALPAELVDAIRSAGGAPETEADLVRDEEGVGVVLSDDAIDWVESRANQESDEQP